MLGFKRPGEGFQMCSDVAITIKNISKCFEIYQNPKDRLKQMVYPKVKKILGKPRSQYYREFWAVKDVSFTVRKGETVGIIGRNGSGKSTLLQMICGTLMPTTGTIETNGRVAALLELGSGFNPEFTGRENVFLNASLYGLSYDETVTRFERIINFADIGEFIDQPVKTYSSGMMVRLAFAVIAHVDADILVIDEALAVGDTIFTQKCMRFIREFQKNGTLLFVSHDSSAVQNLCKSAVWLSNGEVKEVGTSKEVSELYLQYSLQELYGKKEKLETISNEIAEKIISIDTSRSTSSFQREYVETEIYNSNYEVVNNLGEANGWKTGKANIFEVEFLDINNRNVNILRGGEIVCLRVLVEAHEEFSNPIIGFLVKDRLGQDLFGENTLPFTDCNPIFAKCNDIIKAEFVFKLPMLPNGQYSLMVSFGDGDLHNHVQHHWLHDAVIINIASEKIRWGLVGLEFQTATLETAQSVNDF